VALLCSIKWQRSTLWDWGNKRLAIKASLQNPYEEQKMTPKQLYKWAVAKIPSVILQYCTVEDHSKETVIPEEGSGKLKYFQVFRKCTV
jgi:hypothetical protein